METTTAQQMPTAAEMAAARKAIADQQEAARVEYGRLALASMGIHR